MRQGNIRDLGGLATTDGRTIRPGVLLRSEDPVTLAAAEREQLNDVALVIDLRAKGESGTETHVWTDPGRPEVVHVPLVDQHRVDGAELLVSLGTDPEFTRTYMTDIYRDLLDALGRECLPTVARRVGEDRKVPVLIHCAGGQDRTGLVIAVLLLALGVPRDVVLADYVRTVESWDLPRLMDWMRDALGSTAEPTEAAVEYLLARPEYLDGALDRLLAEHGSIDAYWAAAGVGPEGLDRLREVLLQGQKPWWSRLSESNRRPAHYE